MEHATGIGLRANPLNASSASNIPHQKPMAEHVRIGAASTDIIEAAIAQANTESEDNMSTPVQRNARSNIALGRQDTWAIEDGEYLESHVGGLQHVDGNTPDQPCKALINTSPFGSYEKSVTDDMSSDVSPIVNKISVTQSDDLTRGASVLNVKGSRSELQTGKRVSSTSHFNKDIEEINRILEQSHEVNKTHNAYYDSFEHSEALRKSGKSAINDPTFGVNDRMTHFESFDNLNE